jgi:transposase
VLFLCRKIFRIETVTIPKAEYEALKQTILDLQAQVKALQEEIKLLREENKSLREENHLLKNGRKSNTSSTPPSHDFGRSKKTSLREPTTRKPGGQPGHEGTALLMKEIADTVVEYRPDYCQQCGEGLSIAEAILVARKQEIELPPIIPVYVEHQSYSCTCKKCSAVTVSELPERLKASIQYAPKVSAWVAYLSVRQYLPYQRIAEFFRDCLNMPLCQGTIDNMLKDLTAKAEPIYENIKQRVSQSPVVGGDETGIKIKGAKNNKGWLFTFQTPLLTFLAVSLSRGFDTISNLFKNGFPISVYVTDCLPAQLKVNAKAHQICLSHLLRELNNFIDVFKCKWSIQLKELFKQALELKLQMNPQDYLPAGQAGLSANEKVIFIQQELDRLLQTERTDKQKKVRTFIKRLNKNHDSILTFLYHPKVPPDNNGSERAIRNAKVKMKVSNQFRAFAGAHRFAVLRSIIDTTIKNSQNVLEALSLLPNLVGKS